MSKRNRNRNLIDQRSVEVKKEEEKTPEALPETITKSEESMSEIFNLNETKTFSKEEPKQKMVGSWGNKK